MISRGFTQINADNQSDRPRIYTDNTDMIAPVHRILSVQICVHLWLI